MPLKGVPKVLTPDILHTLSSMGHGDEIVLADAQYFINYCLKFKFKIFFANIEHKF
jgi:L-fucose mutarotase/ribose pyranase (RbsD/FucU family)